MLTPSMLGHALAILQSVQQRTASITVTLGGVSISGQVRHGTLTIIDAPSAAVQALLDKGFSLSISSAGAEVQWFKD